jgi:anti-sigma regulatory factor (Ser/Thr protein kinase)
MPAFKKSYFIKSRDFIRAGEASIKIQNLLKSLKFGPQLIRRVAICGYEGEMNVVMHGRDGSLSFAINTDQLTMEISDDGPGIVDIEKAMQKGYSAASDEHREMGFGAGMGLPNMKRNADEIIVEPNVTFIQRARGWFTESEFLMRTLSSVTTIFRMILWRYFALSVGLSDSNSSEKSLKASRTI